MQFDRQQSILNFLKDRQSASVRELAEAVYASEASVRRDLAVLETQGYVRRVYGGVVLAPADNLIVPVELRDGENAVAKNVVAKRAAEQIQNGSTLIMDASSTTRRILKYLGNKQNLRIFTNNLRVFEDIGTLDAEVYCTGGIYNRRNHAFTGPAAESFIRSVSADLCFFSSQGINEMGEITDVSEEETSLRREMLRRAKKRIFLCDDSKLGVQRDFLLCHRSEVDEIICNVRLPWE